VNPPSRTPEKIDKWFVCPQVKPEAKSRVFLFPYAGGGTAVFSKWSTEFPSNIEVHIAHYPGRGSRHNETPIRSLVTLIDRLAQAIQPLLDKPYIFFGHSLGGTIAFELTHHLRQNELPQPHALFVSACPAPHLPRPHAPTHVLPDDEFLTSLKKLGGISDEILQNQEMLDLLLPVLRADFELIETYRHTYDKPLDCPIFALGGIEDPRVSHEQLEGWTMHTHAAFESTYFPGDHFFINTARASIIESMNMEIGSPRQNGDALLEPLPRNGK
jgi:medium-chain acyl-[acyl-carrier-protein] hydrolase